MRKTISGLQQHRHSYQPKVPKLLQGQLTGIAASTYSSECGEQDSAVINKIEKQFPHSHNLEAIQFEEADGSQQKISLRPGNFAVILSGGQAPGGHNVIAGLFDAVNSNLPGSKIFGFLGGPAGLVAGKFREITAAVIDDYRNTGGFDIIGSGRTKLETPDQFAKVQEVCQHHGIKTIVIIGGDDSNTNAALLAEYLLDCGSDIVVVGCPKTIDGDLKSQSIEVSFGFDTATKTYAELIGNIARDAISARKYWHFIRLMGRSASHITLECSLRCQPDVTLISEEIAEQQIPLQNLVNQITDVIIQRSLKGKNYGIVLIPEGLIEFLPGFHSLIQQLNDLLAQHGQLAAQAISSNDFSSIAEQLTGEARQLFLTLPVMIRSQLLADRDPHGNVQVSKIETEKLLVSLISAKIKEESSISFSPVTHFFGYEGRSCCPSNFDSDYCYALGKTAFLLGAGGYSGYIACIRNLSKSTEEWLCCGVPVTSLLTIERRHGQDKAVIRKALVDLNGIPYHRMSAVPAETVGEDRYLFPGPIQFFGPSELCDRGPLTLLYEHSSVVSTAAS